MPIPDPGPILDATAYGVVGDGVTDGSPGLEAAVAAVRARANVAPGRPNPPSNAARIILPAGTIKLSRPLVLDCDYLEIVGRGAALTRLAPADYGPGIVVERTVPVPPSVRPDSFGVLDTSIAPAPGMAWGFATREAGATLPGWFLVCSGFAPATFPGGWESRAALTIDACFAAVPTGGALFGLGSPGNPSPWVLSHRVGDDGRRRFYFDFRCDKGGWLEWGDPPRTFSFGDVDALPAGPVRLTVQLDMNRLNVGSGLCPIRAWVNQAEQPIQRGYGTNLTTATAREPSFATADGLHFRPNRLATFHVGSRNWADHTFQEPSPATRPDFAIHGLLIASDCPYTSDIIGNQVRIDGGALNDAYRYRGIGRDPGALIAKLGSWVGSEGRWCRFYSGAASGGTGGMSLIQYEHGDRNLPPVYGTTLRDLSIRQLPLGGDAILLGGLIDFAATNVSTSGGARGIAGLNVGANYHVTLRGCGPAGWDAAYQGTSQIVDCDGMLLGPVGNAGVRLGGCDARFGPIRAAEYTGAAGSVVEILDHLSDYASEYTFGYINVDQEGLPAHPAVYCEKGTIQGAGTFLRVTDVNPGQQDGTTPAVRLVDRWPGQAPARAILTNIKAKVAVASDGDWKVIVDGQVQP